MHFFLPRLVVFQPGQSFQGEIVCEIQKGLFHLTALVGVKWQKVVMSCASTSKKHGRHQRPRHFEGPSDKRGIFIDRSNSLPRRPIGGEPSIENKLCLIVEPNGFGGSTPGAGLRSLAGKERVIACGCRRACRLCGTWRIWPVAFQQ